jgi:hypothetical protein
LEAEDALMYRARADLAQSEPALQRPSLAHEAYVAFVQICKGNSDDADTYEADEELVRRALKRLSDLEMGRPALKPVPASERPWEREGWCDAEGRCWWGRPSEELCNSDWFLATRAEVEEFCDCCLPVVSLPHHALPVPDVRKPDAGPPPLRCPGAHTIAECGGPCEQDFRLCDCGLLQQLNPQRAPNRPARGSESPLSEFSDGGMPLG